MTSAETDVGVTCAETAACPAPAEGMQWWQFRRLRLPANHRAVEYEQAHHLGAYVWFEAATSREAEARAERAGIVFDNWNWARHPAGLAYEYHAGYRHFADGRIEFQRGNERR